MLQIDIITVLPELLVSPFSHSILQRAQDKGLAKVVVHNLRDYCPGKRKNVDDYAYGGGAGMVMKIEPIVACIEDLQKDRDYDEIIYLTPDGSTLNQGISNRLSLKKNLMLLAGHYKGIDQRIRDHFITSEISIGDYVLSGGELPAAILTDSIIRLLPGVLSDETSALSDSFQGDLLDAPIYTRPPEFRGIKVPEILLSGNTPLVDEWRYEQQLEKTKKRRPDLLK
ncbi:MAG: tRNA (guanine37-N1)-methyltransferase [Sphingobacteriales bacterium]|jgi:tRNA (guanine37-N1)-methyltransferase